MSSTATRIALVIAVVSGLTAATVSGEPQTVRLSADFEAEFPKWMAFEEGGSKEGVFLSDEQAHGGKRSLKFASPTGVIRCQLPSAPHGYDGRIELWTWEDPSQPGKRAAGAGRLHDRDSSAVIHIGVADKANVGYRFGTPEMSKPGQIARQPGWHKWTLDFRQGGGVQLLVDDRLLAEDRDRDRFDSISLGVNWRQGKVWYVDDLRIEARRLAPPPGEAKWFEVRLPTIPPLKPHPFTDGIYELLLRQIACEYSYLKKQMGAAPPGKEFVPPEPISSGIRIRELASRLWAFAVALRLGQYDESQTGVTAQEMTRMASRAARAVARTHLVGVDVTANGRAWGGEWQSALWAAVFGKGAWLLWDALDEETRQLVPRVVAYEADRFLKVVAPHQEFLDTKAEENAWNSEAIALAYVMLPNHPHREQWRVKAIEYMITATARAADLQRTDLFDGKPLKDWLRGANVHEDFTMENHGFVHPDYTLSFKLNFWNAAVYLLGGEPIPQALYFNGREIVNAMRPFLLPDGCLFYPQGTDWSVHRVDCGWGASSLNAWFPDPVLARGERKSYATARLGLSLPRGHTLFALEHWGQNVWCLAEHVTAHRLFGPGAEPASDDEWRKSTTCVRVFKDGKFALHRTANSVASFSWFPTRLMGLALPLREDNLVYPTLQSLVGYVGPTGAFKSAPAGPWAGPPRGTDQPKLLKHEVVERPDGLSVTCRLLRLDGAVEQVCAFHTLADGSAVYLERLRALKLDASLRVESLRPVTGLTLRTGLVSILDNTRWPIADPARFTGDVHGGQRRIPWLRQKEPRRCASAHGVVDVTQPRAQAAGKWVNVDDVLGLIRAGTGDALVVPYQQAGFQVVLNAVEVPASAEGVLSVHASVLLPNRTTAETEALAETARSPELGADGAVSFTFAERTFRLPLSP